MRKIISPCGFHCIKVNHLGVWFSEQEILKDVNLHMHCGSLNAIIGKNGAGKSTLIRAMLGDIPHTGDIEFRDTKDGQMQNLKIGYVPQSINIEKIHRSVSMTCWQAMSRDIRCFCRKNGNYMKRSKNICAFLRQKN